MFMPELNATPAPCEFDYKAFSNYTKWGAARDDKPGDRVPFHIQLSIFQNAVWADEMYKHGVPITDEQAEAILSEEIPF